MAGNVFEHTFNKKPETGQGQRPPQAKERVKSKSECIQFIDRLIIPYSTRLITFFN